MEKVFIVMRHDYEADGGREFSPNATVEGVFKSRQAADDCVDAGYGGQDPSEAPFGFEVEEHEVV